VLTRRNGTLKKNLKKKPMMKTICYILLMCFTCAVSVAQVAGPVLTDQEGNKYKTVRLGTQTWMAENLNTHTFKNGDLIPQAKTPEEWMKADLNQKPAWCYYNNDPANGLIYGKLYNWWAINDPRGIAPPKWHVPNDEEWTRVTLFLGGSKIAAQRMKHTLNWQGKAAGTNKTNFAAVPGGSRDAMGLFRSLGSFGIWWTSEQLGFNTAWGREMGASNKLGRYNYQKGNGFSIRCVRD
jgi:uncharacterized protein (TIGR02145 family)